MSDQFKCPHHNEIVIVETDGDKATCPVCKAEMSVKSLKNATREGYL